MKHLQQDQNLEPPMLFCAPESLAASLSDACVDAAWRITYRRRGGLAGSLCVAPCCDTPTWRRECNINGMVLLGGSRCHCKHGSQNAHGPKQEAAPVQQVATPTSSARTERM